MRFAAALFGVTWALGGQVILQAPQPPAKPEDLCTIEGQVANAETGAPLKKASILMTRTDAVPSPGAPAQSYTTTTDASGKFAMKDIEPGKYRLNVTRTGFVTMSYGARGPGRPGTTLALGRAQNARDINFRLTPHGVVSGRIVDEDGDPAPNVPVQLLRFQYQQGKKQLITVGNRSTDDLGEFRIFGIAPGKYYVEAMPAPQNGAPAEDRSGAPVEAYVPTYYPGTVDPATAAPIDVGGGATVSGLNMNLLKVATVHVKGSVINNVVNVRQPVVLYLRPRNSNFSSAVRPTAVGANGDFDLRGVVPGQYSLAATLSDGNKINGGRVPLEVGNSNVENVTITIGPGAHVTGSVRMEDNTQAISEADIRLQQRESGLAIGRLPPARIQNDGSFRLADVATDVFDVTLTGLPDGTYVKSMRSGDTDVLTAGLDTTRGALPPLEIVLSPKAAALSGVVQNPKTGNPAPAATVALIPQEKERRDHQQYYKTTTTDQNGSYSFKNLVPGEYKVIAWEDLEPGAYMDPEFVKPVESKAEAITLQETIARRWRSP